jgi:hypothetical protein
MGDLLVSRPGRIVRTDGPPEGVIMPLTTPSNMMAQIVPALEYCDLQREMRTGIGKDTMGVDADALQDVTKGGQLASMSAAAKKVQLVARLLAEGVKDTFQKIHNLLRRHQQQEMVLQITGGRWITQNPSEWRERTELVINVGLGSGTREEARSNIVLLGQAQKELAPFGLVGPKQAFNTFRKVCHLLGYENPSEFALDPDSPEYQQVQAQRAQQPQDPRIAAAQIKATSDQQIEGMRAQATQAKANAEVAQAQAELAHGAQQAGADRQIQQAQINSQEWQTMLRVIGQIVASQLKQDAAADAGAMVNQDMGEVQRGS